MLLGDLVAQITAAQALPIEARPLSGRHNVFVITLPSKARAVIRIPTFRDNTSFEKFAADLFKKAGVLTPEIELLDQTVSDGLVQRLAKAGFDGVAKHVEAHAPHRTPRVSIAPFVADLEEGESVLGRTWVDRYSRRVENMNQLPLSLRTAAFDFWVLSEVVGVKDPHSRNWALHGDQFIALDLADRNFWSIKGQSSLFFSFNPLSLSDHECSAKLVFENSSEDVRTFLRGLTAETLLAQAQASNYPVSTIELNGMLSRRDHILSAQCVLR